MTSGSRALVNAALAFSQNSLFYNGKFCAPAQLLASVFESFNPSTGQVALKLTNASEEDVNRAVQAATDAARDWRSLTGRDRGKYLLQLADLVKKNQTQLAHIESFDCGKPLKEAFVDMEGVVSCLRVNSEYAAKLDSLQDSAIGITESDKYTTRLRYEPYGVVGLITAWNYPLLMAIQKVAPALAAGCTCVLKPSENASLTCIEFADLCRQVELPAGVFNLLTGLGSQTAAAIVRHPQVRKISFTGSVNTGKAVMRNAADSVKPVHLELGGKSPMVVFDDVSVKAVVDWIMTGIFWGSGQVCSATSRVLVHKNIYAHLCEVLKRETEKLRIGPVAPAEENQSVDVGPLVSAPQFSKVLAYLEMAKHEGLQTITGGAAHRGCESEAGYFVQPTIYVDVPLHSKLWKEEIFGPVLCMRSFETEEEAVQIANDTEYGLAAAVMTKDNERKRRVVDRLEAGMIWENCSQPVFQNQPFGGYKMSGFGRECGFEGFMEYLQIKTVTSCDHDFFEETYVKAPES